MKIQAYELSKNLRKETELLNFIEDVRNVINTAISSVLTNVQATGQTAAISATTIYTPSVAWFFRISVYVVCTTAGGGTLTTTIRWTDEVGAKSIVPVSDVDLSSTANGSTGEVFIRANVAAITFETAIAGISGSPTYSLYIVLEQLG